MPYTQEQQLILKEDLGLPGGALDDKYNPEGDGEHPVISRQEWRDAVAQQDTVSGYWDWAAHRIATLLTPSETHGNVEPHPLARYDALNETRRQIAMPSFSAPYDNRLEAETKKQPESQVGCTMFEGSTLELMDDGTLQIRNRHTDVAINLGQAAFAEKAMREALDRLSAHL